MDQLFALQILHSTSNLQTTRRNTLSVMNEIQYVHYKNEFEKMWDEIFVAHSKILFSLTCLKGIKKNTKLKVLSF